MTSWHLPIKGLWQPTVNQDKQKVDLKIQSTIPSYHS